MVATLTRHTKTIARRCVSCRKPAPEPFTAFCACGAMIEVEYDLAHAALHPSANPLERFFDLLPAENAENLLKWDTPYTPCVHARRLGKILGMDRLHLKDESVLPTGTTKDRMARVALAYLWESGVRSFTTSSTGNSSTAYAHAIPRFPGMRMALFTAELFGERVDYGEGDQVQPFVLRDATFVDAFNAAGQFAKRFGMVSERGFFNPGRREGLKLAFLEAVDQIPTPIDWYVQAVSSAMGVYGTYKAARELHTLGAIARLPRLLCVQQDTCAPMVSAFRDGSPAVRPKDIVARPTGIAKAILRGDPSRVYPYVRDCVIESRGDMIAVSEADIREARRMVEELEGLRPCFSAAAALAGLVKQVRAGRFPVHDTVMVNLTGSDRPPKPSAQRLHYLKRVGEEWEAEDPTDDLAAALRGAAPTSETQA